jgi:hypothetical protein
MRLTYKSPKKDLITAQLADESNDLTLLKGFFKIILGYDAPANATIASILAALTTEKFSMSLLQMKTCVAIMSPNFTSDGRSFTQLSYATYGSITNLMLIGTNLNLAAGMALGVYVPGPGYYNPVYIVGIYETGGNTQVTILPTNIDLSTVTTWLLATSYTSRNTTALGSVSKAAGSNSFAQGYNALSTGSNSAAIGYNSIASGDSSFACGSTALASGDYAVAIGANTIASGRDAIALGSGSKATALTAAALNGATASGTDSFAANSGEASGGSSVAFGNITIAAGYLAFVMGHWTKATGIYSFVGGNGGSATTDIVEGTGECSFTFQSVTANSGPKVTAATNSVVLGGKNNATDASALRSVVLGGDGQTATIPDTVYLPKLKLKPAGLPTGLVAGDAGLICCDAADANKMKYWNGTAWVAMSA